MTKSLLPLLLCCLISTSFLTDTPKTTIRQGKDHALFFVVEDYDHWDDLQFPIDDAEAIAKLLKTSYNFDTTIVRNPTWDDIDQRLRQYLSRSYTKDEQLLIWFGGHGDFDDQLKQGYFIPKDGANDTKSNCFSFLDLKQYIKNINCHHILLSIDACYSGTFDQEIAMRGKPSFGRPMPKGMDKRDLYIQEELALKTRLFIASGKKERVPDNSDFATYFKRALRNKAGADNILSFKELDAELEKARPKPHVTDIEGNQQESNFLFIGQKNKLQPKTVQSAEETLWQLAVELDNLSLYKEHEKLYPNSSYQSKRTAAIKRLFPLIIPKESTSLKDKDNDSSAKEDLKQYCYSVQIEAHNMKREIDLGSSKYENIREKIGVEVYVIEKEGTQKVRVGPFKSRELATKAKEKLRLKKVSGFVVKEEQSFEELQAEILVSNNQMVFVKGGTFTMGCTSEQGKDCDDDEKPPHQVTVSNFYISKYEVTNQEFCQFLNEKGNQSEGGSEWLEIESSYCNIEKVGSGFQPKKGYGNHPVIEVSWYGAVAYCKWKGVKYRLPTEAEWEYAARGGIKSKGYKYAGSNDVEKVAWYGSNLNRGTHPIGEKQANELGIYDMSGNVWEWCSDWYDSDYYKTSPKNNPKGADSGSNRVLRGGSWGSGPTYQRVAYRNNFTPSYRFYSYGFRISRAAP